ncbi:hypothetical protein EVAR_48236_1 [Eumeta japonica]|uniref:Uncharacterized protein n=1 Tax=Eumeta variegata TaxID=151549 RepID=A0A4C1YDK7_EUMVA|nr:hypothetical protein EVAR_48236_1 [Eumeta japonica]
MAESVTSAPHAVIIRNKELEFVYATVFLGITLDNRLQRRPHVKVPIVVSEDTLVANLCELSPAGGARPFVTITQQIPPVFATPE